MSGGLRCRHRWLPLNDGGMIIGWCCNCGKINRGQADRKVSR